MTYQANLTHRVNQTLKKYAMLKKGDKVLVCVSGGPDSLALLYILNSLKKEYNLSLHVAHLNHMMRKQDAQRDAIYVKKIAEGLKIPVTVETKDIPKLIKETRGSPEDVARTARYDFFCKLAKKINASKIATAHTQDDQAETILMRLIKGAGTEALAGIPPTRKTDNITIIRPLLETSKSEALKFLKEKGLKARLDKSNLKPVYFRNKIRLELLPLLERYNPGIKESLARIAQTVYDDYEYLEKQKALAFLNTCQVKDGRVQLGIKKFLTYPIALEKGILRNAIKLLKGNLRKITYKHWQDLTDMIAERKVGSIVDLPDGLKAVKKADKILFTAARGAAHTAGRIFAPKTLKIPGKTTINGFRKSICTKILKGPLAIQKRHPKNIEYLDLDKIKLPVIVRARKHGDRMKPLGMKGHKKLQDIFVDEKVPQDLRGRVPVLESAGEVIWVCGMKISDNAKLTEKTKRALRLEYVKN